MSRTGVAVVLRDLHRSYAGVPALDGLDLALEPGEFVSLLGPSGCGKTTALRVLAGLETADSGAVLVGGRDVGALPANKRDMGMVFQAYSLFPNLTARDNVGFGLRLRGIGGSERARQAGEMLELVGLSSQAAKYPHQMSGGQQQRVALARALAIRPQVLLLDEPLSALDAKVRVQLREEIRRLQKEFEITTLFVTHDQEEAVALADQIVLLSDGRVEQAGPPRAFYDAPASLQVARFFGGRNEVPAQVIGGTVVSALGSWRVAACDGPAVLSVRPEAVVLDAAGVPAELVEARYRGTHLALQVRLRDGTVLHITAPPTVEVGHKLHLSVPPSACSLLAPKP